MSLLNWACSFRYVVAPHPEKNNPFAWESSLRQPYGIAWFLRTLAGSRGLFCEFVPISCRLLRVELFKAEHVAGGSLAGTWMGAHGLCCRGPRRGYPGSRLGHRGLLTRRETCWGVWPQRGLQTGLCGFVRGPRMPAESFASVKMNVSQLRTVSPLPSSRGFFHLIKVIIYPSNKLNVSRLYYCRDVERLVAGWPCFWFYGLGPLRQQRGVATRCTPLSAYSWDDQRFGLSPSVVPRRP